jgi:hypothetical protein
VLIAAQSRQSQARARSVSRDLGPRSLGTSAGRCCSRRLRIPAVTCGADLAPNSRGGMEPRQRTEAHERIQPVPRPTSQDGRRGPSLSPGSAYLGSVPLVLCKGSTW